MGLSSTRHYLSLVVIALSLWMEMVVCLAALHLSTHSELFWPCTGHMLVALACACLAEEPLQIPMPPMSIPLLR
jgi:hypothetical protein